MIDQAQRRIDKVRHWFENQKRRQVSWEETIQYWRRQKLKRFDRVRASWIWASEFEINRRLDEVKALMQSDIDEVRDTNLEAHRVKR